MSIDQIMQAALDLPKDLRLQLIEELLSSIEVEVDQAVQSEWLTVAQARRDEIRNALVQPIAGDEALAQVRQLH
ncbi:MAG: addiction module protein [Cyanobacteria bacterium P01_H01_bin.119]